MVSVTILRTFIDFQDNQTSTLTPQHRPVSLAYFAIGARADDAAAHQGSITKAEDPPPCLAVPSHRLTNP